MARLPGIAPGHAPWRGAILLLNHNRALVCSNRREEAHSKTERKTRKRGTGKSEPRHLGCYERIKKGRERLAPGPCHFNKEQTPPGDLLDPSPRIHGGCFGVWGHTSSEALKL